MRDIDVREAIRDRLNRLHKGDDQTLIVEEMGIWAGCVRVDIAVINGEFHGFELKSARDTLERLPRQAAIYNEVFDRVTLVMAEKHFEKAHNQIPHWWGILSARIGKSEMVALEPVRKAGLNPNINPIYVARLFWRDEAISLMEKHGIARGFKSKPLEVIVQHLSSSLPLKILRDEARAALKARDKLSRQTLANV